MSLLRNRPFGLRCARLQGARHTKQTTPSLPAPLGLARCSLSRPPPFVRSYIPEFAIPPRRNKMTENLEGVPHVTRLSALVYRILAQNPGRFSLQGTNTYLCSPPEESRKGDAPLPAVLIDVGEGKSEYEPLLEGVLSGKAEGSTVKRYVTDVILTHWHYDHVRGLPSVLALLAKHRPADAAPPRVHKYWHDTDAELEERLEKADPEAKTYTPPAAGTGSAQRHKLLHTITCGEDGSAAGPVPLSDARLRESVSLLPVHTPGHASDHVCLYFKQESRLFSGDHVLGQGTSVFEDLGTYMRSLKRCVAVLDGDGVIGSSSGGGGGEKVLYPAHGPIVENGRAMLEQYYGHRMQREKQVLELLQQPPPPAEEDSSSASKDDPPAWTAAQIVANLYASHPQSLWPAASRGIVLHLHKLASALDDDGKPTTPRIRCLDAPPSDAGQAPELPSGLGMETFQRFAELAHLRWAPVEQHGRSRAMI